MKPNRFQFTIRDLLLFTALAFAGIAVSAEWIFPKAQEAGCLFAIAGHDGGERVSVCIVAVQSRGECGGSAAAFVFRG